MDKIYSTPRAVCVDDQNQIRILRRVKNLEVRKKSTAKELYRINNFSTELNILASTTTWPNRNLKPLATSSWHL